MHSTAINKRTLNMANNIDNYDVASMPKRQQTSNDETEQPSPVLLLRNLARGVTEVDVEGFLTQFTKNQRPKIYLQASGGRAFVEFADKEVATKALEHFKQRPIKLKGNQVQVNYSTHHNVTTMEERTEKFKVLLASVTNLLYPVDLDLIYYLFNKYGQIDKIVTFSRSPTMYQALIQFANPENAKNAMLNLHNRNIYDGCNTLQIQPSRLAELTVKTNSVKSWDYRFGQPPSHNGRGGQTPTIPNVNYGPGPHIPTAPSGNGLSSHISTLENFSKEIRDLNLEASNRQQTPVLICYNLPEGINVRNLFNLFSLYGSVYRIKILREKADTALIQYMDPLYATIAYNLLQNANVMGNELQIRFSKNLEVKMPSADTLDGEEDLQRNKEFSIKEQRFGMEDIEKYSKGLCKPTQTLFIANVHHDVTEEDLKNLLSPYGEVIKIQLKQPREGSQTQMAIISMENDKVALAALMNLHNTQFQSRTIKVAFSKMVLQP